MSEPFIGAVKMLGFSWPPRTYANCDGSLIATSKNAALFSLLSSRYGGDGRTSFGLPDLRGRVAINTTTDIRTYGYYPQGSKGGVETVALSDQQMASHSHPMQGSTQTTGSPNPTADVLSSQEMFTVTEQPDLMPLYENSVQSVGYAAPHNNMMPCLPINFSIALQGTYPQRSDT